MINNYGGNSMHRQTGFTLVELMIVVAIIAILSSIALPAYSDYVKRSRITEAVSGLSDSRARAEQYFQDNRSYAGACAVNVNSTSDILADDSASFDFRCSAAPTATTYSLSATGKGPMAGFTYTVDQANARATTVTGVARWSGNAGCWVLSTGGKC